MKNRFGLKHIDHIVLVTRDVDACVHFYSDILGMRHEVTESNGQHSLRFGNCKINLHTFPHEFDPSADNPDYGSLDFCLISDGDIDEIKMRLEEEGVEIIEGIVEKEGADGTMDSIYMRDPDGNLVEIACCR